MAVSIGFDTIGKVCQTSVCQNFRPARNVKRVLQLEIRELNRDSHAGYARNGKRHKPSFQLADPGLCGLYSRVLPDAEQIGSAARKLCEP